MLKNKSTAVYIVFMSMLCLISIILLLWGDVAYAAGTQKIESSSNYMDNKKIKPSLSIPILMYHEIGEGPNSLYVTPKNFHEQINFIKNQGYKVITLAEAMEILKSNSNTQNEKYLVLTFDDGYASFYTEAWPVLREAGFTATVFIISHLIDQVRYLNWSQVIMLQEKGIEFGSHTQTHPNLLKLEVQKLNQEIKDSRKEIEDKTGTIVFSFCYPGGYFNQTTQTAVINAGYSGAVTTRHGFAQTGNNSYALSRIRISKSTNLKELSKVLNRQ